MQRTRLTTLVESFTNRLSRQLINPWRRLSLITIALLFGYFLAVAVSSVAGQVAELDIVISAILLVAVEMVNWLFYRRGKSNAGNNLLLEVLQALKIGLTYSLFVEAFKLGS